jgi:hypothetical protein
MRNNLLRRRNTSSSRFSRCKHGCQKNIYSTAVRS